MVRITKPEILEAHLRSACHLVALEDAAISAHLVIMAAEEIFRTWYVKKNVLWDYDYRIMIKTGRQKEYLDGIRKKYNFFKHADRDIDEAIDVDFEELRQANEIQLAILLNGYRSVFSIKFPAMEWYMVWFLTSYPDLLDRQKLKSNFLVEAAQTRGKTLSAKERRQALRGLFYKAGILPRDELSMFLML